MGSFLNVLKWFTADRALRTALYYMLSAVAVLVAVLWISERPEDIFTAFFAMMVSILLPAILIPVYLAFDDCYITGV